MASRQKLTPSDVEKIQAEIRNRKVNIRHEILEEVKEARAQGDYSENYELYAAKRAKNQNESRIRYLEGILKNAIIISDESTDGQVSMNNLVTIYFPEDDLEETYKITTSIRSNSSENRPLPNIFGTTVTVGTHTIEASAIIFRVSSRI